MSRLRMIGILLMACLLVVGTSLVRRLARPAGQVASCVVAGCPPSGEDGCRVAAQCVVAGEDDTFCDYDFSPTDGRDCAVTGFHPECPPDGGMCAAGQCAVPVPWPSDDFLCNLGIATPDGADDRAGTCYRGTCLDSGVTIQECEGGDCAEPCFADPDADGCDPCLADPSHPGCDPCLDGVCSEEERCTGSCRGPGEDCETSGPEAADCACHGEPEADEPCRTIGAYGCNDAGTECCASCRLTGCTNGRDDNANAEFYRQLAQIGGDGDGIDAGDLGCYDFGGLSEGFVTFQPEGEEFDHDPYAGGSLFLVDAADRLAPGDPVVARIRPTIDGGRRVASLLGAFLGKLLGRHWPGVEERFPVLAAGLRDCYLNTGGIPLVQFARERRDAGRITLVSCLTKLAAYASPLKPNIRTGETVAVALDCHEGCSDAVRAAGLSDDEKRAGAFRILHQWCQTDCFCGTAVDAFDDREKDIRDRKQTLADILQGQMSLLKPDDPQRQGLEKQQADLEQKAQQLLAENGRLRAGAEGNVTCYQQCMTTGIANRNVCGTHDPACCRAACIGDLCRVPITPSDQLQIANVPAPSGEEGAGGGAGGGQAAGGGGATGGPPPDGGQAASAGSSRGPPGGGGGASRSGDRLCLTGGFHAGRGPLDVQGWTPLAPAAEQSVTGPFTQDGVTYLRLRDDSPLHGLRTELQSIPDAALADRDWTLEMRARILSSDSVVYPGLSGMNMLIASPGGKYAALYIDTARFGFLGPSPDLYAYGRTADRTTTDSFHDYAIHHRKNGPGVEDDTFDILFDGQVVIPTITRDELWNSALHAQNINGVTFGIGSTVGRGTMDVASVTFRNTEGFCPPLPQCRDGIDNDGDGLTDFPRDPGCASSEDDDERNGSDTSSARGVSSRDDRSSRESSRSSGRSSTSRPASSSRARSSVLFRSSSHSVSAGSRRPSSSVPSVRNSLRSSSSRSVTVSFSQPGSVPVSFSRPSSTVITAGSASSVGGGIGGSGTPRSLPPRTDIPCTRDVECPVGSRCLENGRCTVGSLPRDPGTVAAALAICGNTELEFGEECDDGNGRDFDGCSAACLWERGRCGDGVVQALLDEQCEPSIHDHHLPYGCGPDCRFFSTLCGDAVVDSGEECDQGAANADTPNAYCRTNCSFARCGDGLVDPVRESCDDGNRVAGDGCDDACRRETRAAVPLPARVFEFPRPSDAPSSLPAPPSTVVHAIPAALPATAATGPAALAFMVAGAAAGTAWVRRRRRR